MSLKYEPSSEPHNLCNVGYGGYVLASSSLRDCMAAGVEPRTMNDSKIASTRATFFVCV